MYVCICQAVTDRQIREAVHQGVHSMRGLREHLGVTAECGRCASCTHDILKECRGCENQTKEQACAA